MKTIVCQRCGKTVRFPHAQKYCPDCRAEAYRESVKRWRWNNPERCDEYKHKYYWTRPSDQHENPPMDCPAQHFDQREYQRDYYYARVAENRWLRKRMAQWKERSA